MNILIVDDEPYVPRILKKMIEKASPDWKVVDAAGDGAEACAKLEAQQIDLVITDIRMPVMDGIELAKTVRNRYPDTGVILLTGYKEFDYARQAIQYGVLDYILKPGSFEDVMRAIREAQERKNRVKISARRKLDVVEKRLSDLLHGVPIPHFDRTLLPEYGELRVFTISFMDIHAPEEWDERLALFAIKNATEDWFQGRARALIQEKHVSVILFCREPAASGDVLESLKSLQAKIRDLLRLETVIGVSRPAAELERLPALREQSVLAMVQAQANRVPVAEHCEWAKGINGKEIGNRVVARAIDIMKARLDESVTLESIAADMHYSADYLGKIFREETGMGFSRYLLELRMEKALCLLQDPTLKIYEVCASVGYQDPSYFTKCFKKSYGMTPLEYQKYYAGQKRP